MTDNRGLADDDKKLLPESSRSDDEQVLWLAFSVLIVLGLLVFGISRCGSASDVADNFSFGDADSAGASSIEFALGDDSGLSSSAALFAASGFDGDLGDSNAGPFTVFAPTDGAWEATTIAVDDLTEDEATDAAGFHIVEGEFALDELLNEGSVTTVGGYELNFDDAGLINGSISVEEADIQSDNGIVHQISGLLPAQAPAAEPEPEPEATAAPEPTPEPAAAPEPTAVPEPTPEPAPEPTAVPAPAPVVTIASLAGETADLSQLTGLVSALGLESTLADPDAGPFTVFAPTNDAFDNNAELVGQLGDGDVELVVGYHVVPGLVPSTDIVPGASFETLSGDTLVIGSTGGLPGGVNVVTADLPTDNGIVHVVDGLLVPASVTLRALTSTIALEPIQFDVGSAVIRPESETILIQAAAVLSALPEGTLVEVGGHTDSDGGADGNQSLSNARANAVVTYLAGEGVSADVLSAVGYGEERLKVDPEATDADKQANRRIEFTLPGG